MARNTHGHQRAARRLTEYLGGDSVTHMLIMLPPVEGLSDAEKMADGIFNPICKVPMTKKVADFGFQCKLLGHSWDPAILDCVTCRPEAQKCIDETAMQFAYGELV